MKRPWGAILVLTLMPVFAATPAGASAAIPQAGAVALAPDSPDEVGRLEHDVYLAPTSRHRAAGQGRYRIRHWPGHRIRYYESVPAKWDWSLTNAVDHWNQTGAKIKLVEVSSRRRAQLVIGYGDTGGADGLGTLGYAPGYNIVRLSPRYKKVNEFNPEQRVWVARIFAHEIGHNLGYVHTNGRCDLMVAYFTFGACGPLTKGKPGYYQCRYIDAKLLKRHIGIYGGKVRQQPKDCLIEPLPPALREVTFSGGETAKAPVRIRWTQLAKPPVGSKISVALWRSASCGAEPRSAKRYLLAPTAGSWVDPDLEEGLWCFALSIRNRYGASRPAGAAVLERYVPTPAAPVLGELVWDASESAYRFLWNAPAHTHLEVMTDPDDPQNCSVEYDADVASYADQDTGSYYLAYSDRVSECLVFYAVNDFDRVSPPTAVAVERPRPSHTPTVGDLVPDEFQPGMVRSTVTLPAGSPYVIGIEVVEGACPADPVADQDWWFDGWNEQDDVWYFYAEASGVNCAMFAALDDERTHGPLVSRQFTVD